MCRTASYLLLVSLIATFCIASSRRATKEIGSADSHTQQIETPKKPAENTSLTQQEARYHKKDNGNKADSQKNGAERKITIYTRWLAIAAFLQFAVLALTICVLSVQIRTARNIERPWVLVQTIGNPDENWFEMSSTGYVPGILVRFKVFGKTPARVIEARFTIKFIPSKQGATQKQPDLPDMPNYSDIPTDERFNARGVPVPIETTIDIRRDLVVTNAIRENWNQIRDGALMLCAYGFIRYRDIFGSVKETRGCYVYDFAWGGVLTDLDGNVLNPPGFRQAGPPKYNVAT